MSLSNEFAERIAELGEADPVVRVAHVVNVPTGQIMGDPVAHSSTFEHFAIGRTNGLFKLE